MRAKDAVALAAASVGVSPETAESVVARFLVELARCPACNGEGTFEFVRTVKYPADTPAHHELPIKAGTSGPCPLCGGDGKDPIYVHWHCFAPHARQGCEAERRTEGRYAEEHKLCGPLTIPPLAVEDELSVAARLQDTR